MQTADILIHIDETLDSDQQQQLEDSLRAVEGVIAPRFNKPHMLLVAYNSAVTSSAQLLHKVSHEGLHARLVGM